MVRVFFNIKETNRWITNECKFSPGRFFASMELKAVLAYLILHYDMRFEGEAGRTANFNLSFSVIPSQNAVIQFKRRC